MKAIITTTSSPGRSGSRRRRRRRAAEQRDAFRGTKSLVTPCAMDPVTRGGSAPAPCAMELGYSVLRQLVPSLPRHQQVSNMDILQHVIDYILDLQDALDTSSGHTQETEQSTAELLKGTEADEGGTLLR